MKKNSINFILFCFLFFSYNLQAGCCGKLDIGATFIDVDFLTSGRTQKTDHMAGYKGDANIQVIGGVVLKPSFIWAKGDGELASGTIGIGHYTPIFKGLTLIPSVGVNFSYVRTTIDVKFPELGLILEDQRERFRSVSPYVGLEFCYTFLEKWTLMGGYQYAWSRTHTKISSLVSDTSHCSGSNYTLGLEYSLDKYWAINLGAGYNVSLSKEKHGIRAKGIKIGLAYYF